MNPGLLMIVLIVAGVVTAAIWIIGLRSGRVQREVAVRGLRNGLIAGAILFVGIALFITVVGNGQSFLGGQPSLLEWFALGLFIAAPVTIAVFWLGAVLLPIGLALGGGPGWASYGTWLASPALAIALAWGYITLEDASRPPGPTPAPPLPAVVTGSAAA
jgi:hypothetical protein